MGESILAFLAGLGGRVSWAMTNPSEQNEVGWVGALVQVPLVQRYATLARTDSMFDDIPDESKDCQSTQIKTFNVDPHHNLVFCHFLSQPFASKPSMSSFTEQTPVSLNLQDSFSHFKFWFRNSNFVGDGRQTQTLLIQEGDKAWSQ